MKRPSASTVRRAGQAGLLALLLPVCSPTPTNGTKTGPAGAESGPANADDGGFLGDPIPGAVPHPRAVVETLQAAWAARSPDYVPRTRHLREDGTPRYTNRLFLETSPYLRQHAHNPVNWFPWGEEAFALARELGRPIFLSVGYSTCHWCHVMEEESFEDEEIATFLNDQYIAIKVDREERPDIDGVYMQVVQLMTRRGGWPMTVLMTPDGKPFFGGTYFPPRAGVRGTRKGLLELLTEFATSYAQDPDTIRARGEKVAEAVRRSNTPSAPGDVPGVDAIKKAIEQEKGRYDALFGGFGRAPKFPPSDTLGLMLRYARRTGDAQVQDMVVRTLEAMAAGGIHDQVGGGFHRYSTDARWLVPHFEKMLYDNALLAVAYLEAHQVTGRGDFARVAEKTLDYVAREMTDARGGFYSATDADSPTPSGHREEGYFFTWTEAELDQALAQAPDQLRAVKAAHGVTAKGNFEGRSILFLPEPLAKVAPTLGTDEAGLRATLAAAHKTLYEARSRRPPPLRDDKILTAWNGLMIAAFARGSLVLGRGGDYGERARAAAGFVLSELRDETGRLHRSYRDGKARGPAVIDDYAYLIHGLLELHEATGEIVWLERARELQSLQDTHYRDGKSGAYFLTAHDAETLLARELPDHDGALPSGNSVTAQNLLRLALVTGDDAYRDRAHALLAAFATQLTRNGIGLPAMLAAVEHVLDRPREVFVVSPKDAGAAQLDPLLSVIRAAYLPNRALVVTREGEALTRSAATIKALAGKRAIKGVTTAYVCERGRCEMPTSDPATLATQLAVVTPLAPAAEEPAPSAVKPAGP